MKKILVRGGMSPFESFPAEKIIVKNSIGTNLGNFLYLFGSLRYLVDEDTIVTPTYYKYNYTDKEIEKINQEYDLFLIPLADAFRTQFVSELRGLTRIVERLNIPCVVTGVGLRAPYDTALDASYPFDEDVKAFVKAVLNKSTKLGLRGEITGAYLKRLGFREEEDFTPIGCPSLYLNGPKLEIRQTHIGPDSFVCYNTTDTTPGNVFEFVERSIAEFSDTHFMPQRRAELRLLYTGAPIVSNANPLYPRSIMHKAYNGSQSRFFLNAPTWIEYMKKADFSFGSRLHGNIASMLAGTPSILIVKDARTRELSDYHDMTRVAADTITEKTTIWELIEKADFHQAERRHYANYTHFMDFLEDNNLSPIRQGENLPGELPFDKRVQAVELEPPVESIATCSLEEMEERWKAYWPLQDEQEKNYKNRIKKLNSEKEGLANKNKKLQEEFDKETKKLQEEKEQLIKERDHLKKLLLEKEEEERERENRRLINRLKNTLTGSSK